LLRRGTEFTFVIAGKNAQSATPDGMRYAGAVPEIAPYLNAADVVAVPVTSGGGTRLKVLESIACGTPVVSTALGAEGIDSATCDGLLTVVDGWDGFAEALAAPHVKAGNAPSGFLDMYSWASIVSRIEWPA
jgi:glycosyltransferase involved in cell wall biosynthesis